MFHNRRAHADIKKTTQKFLEPKKDSQARLRALRTLLGGSNLAVYKFLKLRGLHDRKSSGVKLAHH